MLGKIFAVLVSISFVFAILAGRMEQVCSAAIMGAQDAVTLCFSMLGMMCLWNGIIRVLDKAGFTSALTKLVRPLLRLIYPDAYKKGRGIDEIAANFAANLLGLGNAALPLGLRAMEKLSEDGGDVATDDMVTFSVLNTVPLQLMPTTLIALRAATGSARPYEIILPVWICSLLTIFFGALICKLFALVCRKNMQKGKRE